jgi:hypothetical protein
MLTKAALHTFGAFVVYFLSSKPLSLNTSFAMAGALQYFRNNLRSRAVYPYVLGAIVFHRLTTSIGGSK